MNTREHRILQLVQRALADLARRTGSQFPRVSKALVQQLIRKALGRRNLARRRYARGGAEEASHHQALLDAHGKDDDIRPAMSYADFLEEHGMPTHAWVVRQNATDKFIDNTGTRNGGIRPVSYPNREDDSIHKVMEVSGSLGHRFVGFSMPMLIKSGYNTNSLSFWSHPDSPEDIIRGLASEGAALGVGVTGARLDKLQRRKLARGGAEEMTHQDAAFNARSDDAGPALRYAEFFEEHGMPTHAQVIRQHVELVKQRGRGRQSGDMRHEWFAEPVTTVEASEHPELYTREPELFVGIHVPLLNKDKYKKHSKLMYWSIPDLPHETIAALVAEGAKEGDSVRGWQLRNM